MSSVSVFSSACSLRLAAASGLRLCAPLALALCGRFETSIRVKRSFLANERATKLALSGLRNTPVPVVPVFR